MTHQREGFVPSMHAHLRRGGHGRARHPGGAAARRRRTRRVGHDPHPEQVRPALEGGRRARRVRRLRPARASRRGRALAGRRPAAPADRPSRRPVGDRRVHRGERTHPARGHAQPARRPRERPGRPASSRRASRGSSPAMPASPSPNWNERCCTSAGVVLRYGRFYGPGTHHEHEPPEPPRVHLDEAARRTALAIEERSGVIESSTPAAVELRARRAPTARCRPGP